VQYIYHGTSLPRLPLVFATDGGGKLVVTTIRVDYLETAPAASCLTQNPAGNALGYGVPVRQYRRVAIAGTDALAISLPAGGGPGQCDRLRPDAD
jgi:hypothetical protein